MKTNRYVIIAGCGRLGSNLASNLSKSGNSVVVIDISNSGFNYLSQEFTGFKIVGDATSISVLERAGINKADIFIATTDNDNINSMLAQIAKTIYKCKKVLIKIADPENQNNLRHLDIKTVCPVSIVSEIFLRSVEYFSLYTKEMSQ